MLQTAILGLGLLNKLCPLVADFKTGLAVPPAMAKDQSCQVSAQNSKNKGNFFQENPCRVYPTVIANLKKGRPERSEGLPFLRLAITVGYTRIGFFDKK